MKITKYNFSFPNYFTSVVEILDKNLHLHCFGQNSSSRPQQISLKIKMESLMLMFQVTKLKQSCLYEFVGKSGLEITAKFPKQARISCHDNEISCFNLYTKEVT